MINLDHEKLARMGNLQSSEIKQEILSQNKNALGFEHLHMQNLEAWEQTGAQDSGNAAD